MGRVKASTLQQRFGFADPELTTPKHDDLCSWVETNALEIARSFIPEYYTSESKWSRKEITDAQRGFLKIPASRADTVRVESIIWEPLLKNGRGYEVGFIDMNITAQVSEVTLDAYSRRSDPEVQGPPFVNKDNRHRFLDYVSRYGFPEASSFRSPPGCQWPRPPEYIARLMSCSYVLWIECKSTINSLGELFRQLALYRSCIRDPGENTIVVVSPDDRHADRIRRQGYGFVVPQVTNGGA